MLQKVKSSIEFILSTMIAQPRCDRDVTSNDRSLTEANKDPTLSDRPSTPIEDTIGDEPDLQRHLDDIHFNPVKHGLVLCPHLWKFSSFHGWVRQGKHSDDWGCVCEGRQPIIPDFEVMTELMGK